MKFRCVPAYGFGKAKKLELDKNDQLFTPGPGKYKPKIILKQQPIWTIGNSERPREQNEDFPGPGSYNLRYKFPEGPSYSMSSKPKQNLEQMITPGPASYNPVRLSQKNIFSFGQKYKTKSNETSPGPGNYNIRKEEDLLVPSSIFGHAKKFDSDNISKTPGPGNYNYDINTIKVQHPIYSFGRELKILDNINENPGPGSYNQKEYFGEEGKKISMGPKFISKSMEYIPGPGQYNTDNYNKIITKLPSFKIGKEKRFSNIFTENPGPGSYDYADSANNIKLKKPSWKIGTSLRQPLNDITDSPGPGRYNLIKNFGDNAPQYSMRGKDNDVNQFITPGPGKYNIDQLLTSKHYPSWKIGTSSRDDDLRMKIREGFPGPGTYQSYDKHLLNSPKYGFGTEKKYNNKYNDNPGPGSYHIPCSIVEVNSYTREQGVFDDNFKFI